jgi:hypothetical protein
MKHGRMLMVSGVLTMLALSLSGCASSLFEERTALKYEVFSRSCDFNSGEYEVVGPVEAHGSSRVILGLVVSGTEGYGLLMKEAREQYGKDVTTVQFIFVTYDHTGVLYPVYGGIRTTYYGTAVRCKGPVSQVPKVKIAPAAGQ